MEREENLSPFRPQSLAALGGWIVFCFAATLPAVWCPPGEWYAQLAKPDWNPPSWIFGPVWTALYLMMAVAAWLVWQRGGWAVQWRPLLAFVVQWALNALWSPLFFGWRRPDLAFVEILLLWLAVAASLGLFWRVSRMAGWLLVPYLGWVTFAAWLNFTLWQLNR
ncbi:MAG: TspO/MBR family protein [Limisphaerales bacterium]